MDKFLYKLEIEEAFLNMSKYFEQVFTCIYEYLTCKRLHLQIL